VHGAAVCAAALDRQDAGRQRLRAALGEWSPDDVAVLADTLGRLNRTLNVAARGL
jgi:hypothetical protein